MTRADKEAFQSILDQIAPLRAYGVVRTEIRLELAHPDGGLPIALGKIDDEGRLSIDALAAHIPIECAQAYARDLAGLLGARTAGPHRVVLIDAQGNRPSITPLLEKRCADWIALIEQHAALFRQALDAA